ncbi:MAG: metal-sulfur cluster assembly factor, partial [Ilumatobacteraceae bacterium]
MPSTTNEQIIEALRPVEDPELRRSIVDLGMVRNVALNDDGVLDVRIALTVAGCPLRNEITSRVTAALAPLPGVSRVTLDFTVMTDQEREAVRMMLHGDPGATAGQGAAHGHAEGRKVPFAE